jgi:magnesium transporter
MTVRTLVTANGVRGEASAEEVRRRLQSDETGFWLDIERAGEADYGLLLDVFGFHPLTVDDVRQQNQRPKLDEFPGYRFAVLFAADLHGDHLAFRELHLYLSHRCCVTVHDEPAPALAEVRRRIDEDASVTRNDLVFLEYLVISGVVASLFPTLDELDDTIDRLEDTVLERPTPAMLARLTSLKHEVSELRRVLGPQRDVFQRLLSHSLEHSEGDLPLYWRDVYEDLVRQYEQVDSLRDLLTGAMDVYLSTVSNRLNSTMMQLTVIASVFLPLTFLTGFFGMNFAFLVGKITSTQAFVLGVSLMGASLAMQLFLFWLRGWFRPGGA